MFDQIKEMYNDVSKVLVLNMHIRCTNSVHYFLTRHKGWNALNRHTSNSHFSATVSVLLIKILSRFVIITLGV